MIDPSWYRIGGIHCQDSGDIAAGWLAHDKETDTIHLYHACVFKSEPFPMIEEGLNAQGRWIPIAWENKEVADKLLERGCNMIYEAVKDSDAVASVTARDIQDRMRTGRFKVAKHLKNWWDEMEAYPTVDGRVPRGTHPLMDCTRHAVSMLSYAKRQAPKKRKNKNYPEVAIV